MSLGDLVRQAVAIAHKVTLAGDLQEETVTIERWIAQSDTAVPTFAPILTTPALVDRSEKLIRAGNGNEIVSTATVHFLQPLKKLSPAVTQRSGVVDPRDAITLSDGKTGPILRIDSGLIDQSTGRPYIVSVYMG